LWSNVVLPQQTPGGSKGATVRYTSTMRGRLNVIDDRLVQWISDVLGMAFTTQTNSDLRPTHTVDTIAAID